MILYITLIIRDIIRLYGITEAIFSCCQLIPMSKQLWRWWILSGKKTKATLIIPKADLPTEIISLRFKPDSKSTAELYLNNGWSLSFRIHNASTIVEPSLKFDIQFLGVPANIITVNCMWK